MANRFKNGGFAFGDFTLVPESKMLYRGDEEISLPPKAVETLIVLVENRGDIVTKSELMDKVWGDSVVEESNVSQYLYLLRKTLGELSNGRPAIETLRRRGFRFNPETRVIGADEPVEPSTPAAGQGARNGAIEREGNVIRVADWTEGGSAPQRDAASAVTLSAKGRRGWASIAIGIGAVAIVVTSLATLWDSVIPEKRETERALGDISIERLTNGIAPSGVAISPDGKYFAYHEQDGEVTHFWVQQTGFTTRREVLPPSERLLGDKTFSPDGQYIYFTAVNKGDGWNSLYRVPTLGGGQVKLIDRVDSPVSFSPDGRLITFSRYDPKTGTTSLVIASSDGGDERLLLEGSAGQTALVYPAWSPDGKLIAFGEVSLAAGPDAGGCALKTVVPDGTGIRSLSPERWDNCFRSGWLSDSRSLVFVGTKYADALKGNREPIYLVSAETGESRRLTSGLANRHQMGSFGVTRDDAILAVPYNRSSQIWVMDPNGDTRTAVQLTNGLADGRSGIAPMSDGRIGYLTWAGESHTVWVMNPDGSDQKQIVSNPTFLEELRATPDGRYFVFASQSNRQNHLYRVDTDGSHLRQLTYGAGTGVDSTVSPDGKWVVYTRSVDGGRRKPLFKITIEGGEPEPLTDRDCDAPHYSPDGRFISCVVDYEKEFMVVSADGTDVKAYSAKIRPVINTGVRWTPDGRNLIYIVKQKDVSNLWLQPVDGGRPRQLTNFSTGQIFNFAYSMDGKRLFLSRGSHQIQDAVLIKSYQ